MTATPLVRARGGRSVPSDRRPFHPALLPLAAALLLLGLAACSAPRPDPATAQRLWSEAEQQFEARDIPAAAALGTRAAAADPGNLQLALRLGDWREMANDPHGAAAAFRSALKHAPASDPLTSELHYRLALLQILKLKTPTEASASLVRFATADPRRGLLEAALSLAANAPRTTLQQLNALRIQPLPQAAAARASYLAALAYVQLGDTAQATAALYRAINLAGKTIVAFDVEQLWRQLKQAHAK